MRKLLLPILIIIISANIFAQKSKITLDDIFPNKVYKPAGIGAVQWRKDESAYTFVKFNKESKSVEIYEHNIASGVETPLVEASSLKVEGSDKPVALSNYKWSPDEKYIMITGVLPARALKSGGSFYIYDATSKNIIRSVESEKEQENIEFSPDGKLVSFVRDNNLFVFDIEKNSTTQLTFDGSETVLNGHFDWVYEEEFSIIRAYEWAPDSKSIAFWNMDISQEPKFNITRYDSLYLNIDTMRYPKAGGKNAIVKIGVVNVNSTEINWMDIGTETDIYIPRIKYTMNPNELSIQRLDRKQQNLELLLADSKTGKTRTILTEHDNEWIDIEDDLTFLKNGKSLLWTSEESGYKHIYLYPLGKGEIRQITKGNWEVDKIKYIDETTSTIYYTSKERGAVYNDLYSIKFDGTGKTLLTDAQGSHSITFTPAGKYFLDTYSNSNTPASINLYSAKNELVAELVKPDISFRDKYEVGQSELFQFTTSDGVALNAAMIKPADFDSSKKYPVLFYNYSGPGSQTVKDEWSYSNFSFHQVMASSGYIIFMLDNRGTGGRGTEFKHIVYKKLGDWETNDLKEGAKYLSTLPYVDSKRIGIWGWSYGGYISALTLLKDADYFKAAVSVAPVTSWRYYDNIYTERYMSLPDLNPEGYESSAVLNYVDKLKGKLLLIHGTADDNVHFQNSVKFVDLLIASNKQFSTMFYPGKDHGIYGGKTRQQLFTLITKFLLENL